MEVGRAGEPGAGAALAWRTTLFHPRSSAERMRVSEARDAGAIPAGDIRSRGVTDSCMPPCEGGGSRCKSSRERHFQFLRGRGQQCTPLVKETMPGQRRPEDRFQMEAVM